MKFRRCQRCGISESKTVPNTTFIVAEKFLGTGYQCKNVKTCRDRLDEQIKKMQTHNAKTSIDSFNQKLISQEKPTVVPNQSHDHIITFEGNNEDCILALKKLYANNRLV